MSKSSYQIPSHLLVDGIRDLGQHAIANRSKLLKPKEFDARQYVAKWAPEGAMCEAAQEPQILIPGQGYVVDGWTVWTYPKGHKEAGKPCIRPLGSGKLVLMFRPKILQAAVNAIHGNLSKERTIAEQQGRTVQGQTVPIGLLSEQKLRGYDPGADAEGDIPYRWNQIPAAKPASTGGRGRVRTRTKVKAAA